MAGARLFARIAITMREEWRQFAAESRRYLWLLPAGPMFSAIPFALNFAYWRQENRLLTGAGVSLVYGVTMPAVMWLSYGLAYGIRIALRQRIGGWTPQTIVFHVSIGICAMLTGIWISMQINARLFGLPAEAGAMLPSIIFGSFVLFFFVVYLSYRQLKEESLTLRAETAEARYHQLETQMRPHFLFNALNSLAELIESGEPGAAEVAHRLSELYRQILANSGRKTASLSSELGIVRAYLELEQLRFGPRLRFAIRAPEEGDGIHLPSLMLQTLVENAVKHGIAPSLAGGEIRVEIDREGPQRFALRVRNSGAPYDPAVAAAGTGLKNTRARLDLLYPGLHGFAIAAQPNGETLAEFHFTGARLD